jgi:hypothetical protein
LQLPTGFKTIATGPDLVATICEPIATRVGLVETEKKSIEIGVLNLRVNKLQPRD